MESDFIVSKVLIIEDEENIRKFIKINLERNNFEVIETGTGEEAIRILSENEVDVMLLDVMLPGIDGFKVCSSVREKYPDMAIIMLTAKGQDMDKVMGLEIGADDYVVKPFNPLELMARIRTILRRTKKQEATNEIDIDGLLLDINGQKFYKNKVQIELTNRELALIKVLMENPGRAFDRDELLNLAWGKDFYGDVKTVDVHIRRLREKIENDSKNPEFIETVWGYGYRFKKVSK